MFTTDINSGCNIKNASWLVWILLWSCGLLNVILYLVNFLFLYIAVQQQSSVVLIVVVVSGSSVSLLFVWLSSQLVQISDQVVQLRHLDVPLNNIRWIQMPNSFFILLNCFFVIPLRIKLVSVLLANLSLDVFWELSSLSDSLCFLEKILLHQGVNFHVVFHFIQLAQNNLVVWVLSQIVNRVILDLHLQNARVICGPEACDLVCEI